MGLESNPVKPQGETKLGGIVTPTVEEETLRTDNPNPLVLVDQQLFDKLDYSCSLGGRPDMARQARCQVGSLNDLNIIQENGEWTLTTDLYIQKEGSPPCLVVDHHQKAPIIIEHLISNGVLTPPLDIDWEDAHLDGFLPANLELEILSGKTLREIAPSTKAGSAAALGLASGQFGSLHYIHQEDHSLEAGKGMTVEEMQKRYPTIEISDQTRVPGVYDRRSSNPHVYVLDLDALVQEANGGNYPTDGRNVDIRTVENLLKARLNNGFDPQQYDLLVIACSPNFTDSGTIVEQVRTAYNLLVENNRIETTPEGIINLDALPPLDQRDMQPVGTDNNWLRTRPSQEQYNKSLAYQLQHPDEREAFGRGLNEFDTTFKGPESTQQCLAETIGEVAQEVQGPVNILDLGSGTGAFGFQLVEAEKQESSLPKDSRSFQIAHEILDSQLASDQMIQYVGVTAAQFDQDQTQFPSRVIHQDSAGKVNAANIAFNIDYTVQGHRLSDLLNAYPIDNRPNIYMASNLFQYLTTVDVQGILADISTNAPPNSRLFIFPVIPERDMGGYYKDGDTYLDIPGNRRLIKILRDGTNEIIGLEFE